MSDIGSKILGSGSAFPEYEMTNKEFEAFVETSDEWIRTRTGIETRRIADPKKGETTLSLSYEAAKKALAKAKITGAELDCIIIGTVTPNTIMPSTANQLQAMLGAKKAFSFDLSAACSGFIYGLSIADKFIRQGSANYALVLGAETLSSIVNWRQRSTCVLFGDGAGAVVLGRTEDPKHRVIDTQLQSDGNWGGILCLPHGYSEVPVHSPDFRLEKSKITMQGREIFKMAVRSMVDVGSEILERNQLTNKDVDCLLVHQANMRIIEMSARLMKVDKSKMWLNVAKYGNTSAATLPVCLDEAWEAGKVGEGSLILMLTFGGGVTWGGGLMRL